VPPQKTRTSRHPPPSSRDPRAIVPAGVTYASPKTGRWAAPFVATALAGNVRATRALHGSRQKIGDSRAVAGGGQRGAKFFPGSGAACAPRPMARSVLAFEGEGAGADEVGFFGSARPASVAGVDCVDLCRSQFGLKTSKVSAMRRGLTDFGIAPPMIGAAMRGNRAPPRGAGRCAARKQSTRGYASNGHCAPVPTSPNQVRSGG